MTSSATVDTIPDKSPGRLKEALGISIPIIASQLLQTAGGFVSTLMLSKVDTVTFAAGLLTGSVQLAMVTVVFGLLFSMSALIGRVVGEGTRPERVGQLWRGGCVGALLSSVPVMLLLYFIEPCLLWLGQPPALARLCGAFFHIFLWSVPAAGLIVAYTQFMLGTFQQATVFLYSLCSLVVWTVLGWLLIFGKLGLPPLGIEGLGWASVLTQWTGLAVLSLFILRRPGNATYALLGGGPALWDSIRSIVRIGLPISIQMANEIGSFLVTTLMVGWIGVRALEMQQVATRYLMLLVIPIVGLSQAAMIVVSKSAGAGNAGEVRRHGTFYMSMGIVYSVIVLVLFAVFPRPLTALFLSGSPDSADLFGTIAVLLIVVAVGQVFDSVRNVATGALRGLQDSQFPMHVSVLLIWPVGIPLAYYMGFTLGQGLIGMAVAHDLVMAVGSGILVLRWRKKVRALPATG